MTNLETWKLYERYAGAWKAISADERNKTADEVFSKDIHYSTPQHNAGDRKTAIDDMIAFQEKFPGGRFDVDGLSTHHDVALLTWVLIQPDGTALVRGHDLIRLSPEGKISSITTFAPSVSEVSASAK